MRLIVLLSSVLAVAAARESFTIHSTRSGDYTSVQGAAPRRAGNASPEAAALEHLQKLIPDVELQLHDDTYTDEDTGVTHLYFSQVHDGYKVENAVANVNVRKDGSILSAGTSLLKDIGGQIAKRDLREVVPPLDALKAAAKTVGYKIGTDNAEVIEETSFSGSERKAEISNLEGVVGDAKGELVYYVADDGQVKLTWRLETDLDDNYMITYADAYSPEQVLATVDYVQDATYNVYPLGVNDPTDGSRKLVVDPENKQASPSGWLTGSTTRGNNGIAQENLDGGSDYESNYRPTATSGKFDFPYSPSEPKPTNYLDAAITQLFYTSNIYHDLLEVLGFTEAAGNFEEKNPSGQGKGGDAVQLNAQDGTGYNNANFRTPPDGQRPRMRMYVWNSGDAAVMRDGDFDAGIVIHEYTHGLSNRLTGGPAASTCLSTTEAGGMGEGWGDWFATAIRLKKGDTRAKDYVMGDWSNGGEGIRNYPYSTSLTTNPLTYSTVGTSGYTVVHAIGTIWATMLYEVLWNLEDKYGYQEEIFPVFKSGTSIPTKGRQLAMKLVLEGMKLQPCNPTFLGARDAILDADEALTGGANKCEIWVGFAKRGLGTDAKISGSRRIDGFSVPSECKSLQTKQNSRVAGRK